MQGKSDDLWHVWEEERAIYQVRAITGGSWCECKEFTSLETLQPWNSWEFPLQELPSSENQAGNWLLASFASLESLCGHLLPVFKHIERTPDFCLPPSHVHAVGYKGLWEPVGLWRGQVYKRPGHWGSGQWQQRTMASHKKETWKCLWALL